ncbi:MAG TPA: hypothetical protein VEY68_02400 [Anoxybacillus sp.]|nr:hypothetical protein [Anoxybacillus sp.]
MKNLEGIAIFKDRPGTVLENIKLPIVTLSELLESFPKNVSEKINRTLVNLSLISEYPGAKIKVTKEDRALFFTQSDNDNEVFF